MKFNLTIEVDTKALQQTYRKGLVVFGIITAVGGGTVRDVMLDVPLLLVC